MKVLLGMCTRNNEKTIKEQLKSLISQTVLPDEFVFVDKSTDNTPNIIKSVLSNKPYKLIRQKGEGVGDARQEILEYAIKNRYDVIVFLDTDLLPVNNFWFENHCKFHTNNKDYSILNGRLVKQDYEPKSPFKDINYFIQANCSIKTKILEKAGGYDRSLKRGEDWDMAIRLYKIGARSYVSRNVAATLMVQIKTKDYLKRKLNRSASPIFLRKYGIWYLKNYPQHLIADVLGFLNLLSIIGVSVNHLFATTYAISLLFFDAGFYKTNKNLFKRHKPLIILLPPAYGISFLKNLSVTVTHSSKKRKGNNSK